jgi:hypothetical protein
MSKTKLVGNKISRSPRQLHQSILTSEETFAKSSFLYFDEKVARIHSPTENKFVS